MPILIWIFVLWLPFATFALLPLLASKKRNGRYHFADISLPILPSLCVFVGVVTLNPSAVEGAYALFVYPFLCSLICIFILNMHFFIFEKFFPSKPMISMVILVFASVLAFVAGAIAPALHE
jgi:hypothetical protein